MGVWHYSFLSYVDTGHTSSETQVTFQERADKQGWPFVKQGQTDSTGAWIWIMRNSTESEITAVSTLCQT